MPPNPSKQPSRWRWLCVLPAAVLASIGTSYLLGSVIRFAMMAGLYTPSEQDFRFYISLLLMHVPSEVMFVVAGTMAAPRHHRVTAIILAIVAGLLSLLIHVLLQDPVGWVNWLHFVAELSGAFIGVGCVLAWRLRRGITK